MLGARLSADRRRELSAAVASVRRIALDLDPAERHGERLRLVLSPTLAEGAWVGTLDDGGRESDVRIEAADLYLLPQAETGAPGSDAPEAAASIPRVTDLLDGVRSLIGVRDTAGRYLFVNSAMAEFYGVEPSAFLGRTPEQLGLPDRADDGLRNDARIEPLIAHDVDLTDATGRHRRFDVAWRNVASADRRTRYLLEVATETAPLGSDREAAGDGADDHPSGRRRAASSDVPMAEDVQRQLVRSEEAMKHAEKLAGEVRQLEAEIREISQREHARIGHDLHDGLGQELTGVSLLLKSLEDAIERDAPQLRARVRSVRDMVEQSIATARALAQGLSPVHLDRDGFAGALEQLAANSEALYRIPVKYVTHRHAPLPAELAGAEDLYRIAQEAVRNAARHSDATEIFLKLVVDDDGLVITVEDDGRGIEPGASGGGGMGLKIMRYRASIVGASLEIGAREGGGTVVRCSLRHSREGATEETP